MPVTKKLQKTTEIVLTEEHIIRQIYVLRGKKVMLDRDLAQMYGVSTGNLNKAVKRNSARFPDDFMFRLKNNEFKNLMFQSGISKRGGTRHAPFAFTEQGVAMLSSVLQSERAVQISIHIVRVFVRLRDMLAMHSDLRKKIDVMERKYDSQFRTIFKAITRLLSEEVKQTKKIGFREKK